ncbi:MAG: hypothetical protein ACFB2W_25345, partial [Leptolyngbyaceae cyanobacterium]
QPPNGSSNNPASNTAPTNQWSSRSPADDDPWADKPSDRKSAYPPTSQGTEGTARRSGASPRFDSDDWGDQDEVW